MGTIDISDMFKIFSNCYNQKSEKQMQTKLDTSMCKSMHKTKYVYRLQQTSY